ncbi:MAG: glycosyltransferase [Bdellovibrionota bacterium]
MSRQLPHKTVVFVPTYNERDNVEPLCMGLLGLNLDFDLLFLDDNSPDGTGEIMERLAERFPNVHVIHRPGKLGIGSAHVDGIMWAYEKGYERLVSLDCDFTHPPEYVAQILREARDFDVVVGSRYLAPNSLLGWAPIRRLLTNSGHVATRLLLGMPYDATGALRLYRLDRIPRELFQLVQSSGYSFFFESLFVLHSNGFRIHEFPISLPVRTYGNSKMSGAEIVRSLKLLASTFFVSKFSPEKYQLGEPIPEALIDRTKVDPQGWEDYWASKKSAGGLLYDAVASLYRKLIIQRSLKFFVNKYFPRQARVLHAGCGSGQVDTEIRDLVNIMGLDISLNALSFYRKSNGRNAPILHGSIFEIPLPDNSVDGIYNLGVMEHFTAAEIGKILVEFRRVLAPGGRMIIFWPPEKGVSVLFFKALRWFYRVALNQPDKKFHPDEVSRIRSRSHAISFFERANLNVLEYYFGPKDLFTQAVIVAEKPLRPPTQKRESDRERQERSETARFARRAAGSRA